MKLPFAIILICLFLACESPDPVEETNTHDPREQFRGRWRLESLKVQDSTGNWYVPESYIGRNGFIIYDGLGGMGVHHVPAGYDAYALNTGLPTDSLSRTDLEHISRQFIYFGRYSLDTANQLITHHIETDARPDWWNKTAVRRYTFNEDTLTLMPVNGRRPSRITWIKVNDY